MKDSEWYAFVAMFTLGGLFGGLLGGAISDLLGRRNTLFFNNLFFIASYVLMSLFSDFEVLTTGRFLVGLGAGVTTSVVNMYLSEVSPVKLRGAIGVLPQLGIVIGILVSQLLAIPLARGGRPWQWRLLLGWIIVLPILQMILLPFCPESPKFLLVNKRSSERALAAFQKLRRSKNVQQEFEDVKRQELESREQPSVFVRIKALFRRELLKPLLVAIILQMVQQLSGVNIVFSYSKDVFKSVGLSDYEADLSTVMVGLTNVICTIVVVPLMDRMGRRTLLLIGEVGCFLFFSTLSLCQILGDRVNTVATGVISVICVVGFVISFAISLGPIPWLIISEIFPSDVRPFAVSIASTINWLCNFAVLMIFPLLQKAINEFVFLPFACIILASIIFTLLFVMETKGKSVEEIVGISSAVTVDPVEKKPLLDVSSPE
ncbi:MFS transporter solute carrier family 2 (facilitated glucose transporter) [Acrasis kona]